MPPLQLALVGGFLVVRYLITPASKDIYYLVSKRLQKPLWRAGPKLSLDTVLADIAHANQLAKKYPQRGCRLRFSLTWRGYPAAMLKVLRYSRRLASLLGSVFVDCELIPVSGHHAPLTYAPPSTPPLSPATSPGEGRPEEHKRISEHPTCDRDAPESGSKTHVDGDRASLLGPGKREVPGVAAAPDVEPAAASARKGKRERRIKGKRAGCCCCCAEAAATSSCGDLVGIGESRDACDSHQGDGEKVGCEDEGEQEDFGFVEMHACRVATLQQFYSLIKPSVEQMAVDAVFKERAAREAHPYDNSYDGSPSGDSFDISAAPLQPSSSGLASTECCICMDHNVQVVTECAHAFCEECHSRWCETSQVCPLCRSEMPKRSESGALDAYVLAECMLLENDEDDMDLSLRDAGERLMQFLTSLPIAAR